MQSRSWALKIESVERVSHHISLPFPPQVWFSPVVSVWSVPHTHSTTTTAFACIFQCFFCQQVQQSCNSSSASPDTSEEPCPTDMVKMTKSKTFQAYLPSCHRTYSCIHCRAHLANHDELISKVPQFTTHPVLPVLHWSHPAASRMTFIWSIYIYIHEKGYRELLSCAINLPAAMCGAIMKVNWRKIKHKCKRYLKYTHLLWV